MALSIEQLAQVLNRYPGIKRYWIAYSGGLDSHVLLHGLASLRSHFPDASFHAVHIHHGLHADADLWTTHCASICAALNIPLEIIRVDARPAPGESPEAAARESRYAALRRLVHNGDALLTAHHQDDQAETLLLQLFRGAGVEGLAAMPHASEFAHALHLRPLLEVTRAQILDYAQEHSLHWIEDDSNASLSYDRNFLRHQVIPVLKTRWPSVQMSISRSARHMAEAADWLAEQARVALASCRTEDPHALSMSALRTLDEYLRRLVLRAWWKELQVPLPTQAQLQHVLRDVLQAKPDATPCVQWSDVEIRGYRDRIHVLRQTAEHDPSAMHAWDLQSTLTIPGLGELAALPSMHPGIRRSLAGRQGFSIRFRRGGERLVPAGRGFSHSLKNMLQEAGIPPWQRDRTPILYDGEQIVAVLGVCVCESYQSAAGEESLELQWL